jgi:hypothetical protein
VARILAVRPDIGEWMAYRMARRYVERISAGESTEMLDLQLARLSSIAAALSDEELDMGAPEAIEKRRQEPERQHQGDPDQEV